MPRFSRWCPNQKCGRMQVYYVRDGFEKYKGKYICSNCGKKFTKKQMEEVNNFSTVRKQKERVSIQKILKRVKKLK